MALISKKKRNSLLSVDERWLRERQTNAFLVLVFLFGSVLSFSYARRCSFSSIMPFSSSVFFHASLFHLFDRSHCPIELFRYKAARTLAIVMDFVHLCLTERREKKALNTGVMIVKKKRMTRSIHRTCFPHDQTFLPLSPAETEHFLLPSTINLHWKRRTRRKREEKKYDSRHKFKEKAINLCVVIYDR